MCVTSTHTQPRYTRPVKAHTLTHISGVTSLYAHTCVHTHIINTHLSQRHIPGHTCSYFPSRPRFFLEAHEKKRTSDHPFQGYKNKALGREAGDKGEFKEMPWGKRYSPYIWLRDLKLHRQPTLNLLSQHALASAPEGGGSMKSRPPS